MNDASKIKQAIEPLTNLKESLSKAAGGASIDSCVQMAWHLFHRYFRNKIMDLIKCFPADATTKDGKPFWSGHKKFPVVAGEIRVHSNHAERRPYSGAVAVSATAFDKDNAVHVNFMVAATNLYATMLKVHPAKHSSEHNTAKGKWMAEYREPAWILEKIEALGGAPEYVAGAVADLDEAVAGSAAVAEDEPAVLAGLLEELAGLASAPNIFEPADFEKDDDDNFHIDFVAACANLRAVNYRIPEAPREKVKMIAGRIIPAIATTTASVTGLVMLEMYKVLQSKPIEKLRGGNFNLGTNT